MEYEMEFRRNCSGLTKFLEIIALKSSILHISKEGGGKNDENDRCLKCQAEILKSIVKFYLKNLKIDKESIINR